MIVIATIWLIGSVIAIYITDHKFYWDKQYKIVILTSILALIINGWKVYDPSQNHMIATIEINPTWDLTIILSIIEGVCITGPISGLHSYHKYKTIKREKEDYLRRRG